MTRPVWAWVGMVNRAKEKRRTAKRETMKSWRRVLFGFNEGKMFMGLATRCICKYRDEMTEDSFIAWEEGDRDAGGGY